MRKLERLEVPEENKEAIKDFFNYLAAKGLGRARIVIYAKRLVPLASLFGSLLFKDAKKQDIERIMAEIQLKPWSPTTKGLYRVTLKRFYKWLLGNYESCPECGMLVEKCLREMKTLCAERDALR